MKDALAVVLVLTSVYGCGSSASTADDGGTPADTGGGGDAATVETTDAVDDGGDASGPATPLTLTPGQWTWVDFPESHCDDGSPTGIAVSPGDADKLLIFLNGGGACWDALTCVVLSSSTHGPYGQAQWTAQAPGITAGGIFDRTRETNPFRNYGFVFVPYCTGDLHAGNNVMNYVVAGLTHEFHHQGAANVAAYLRRIAATWSAATQVAVTGSSAGGYGAMMNYESIRAQFPAATAMLVDDSGPPLAGSAISPDLRTAWLSAWKIGDLLDPQCPTCRDDLSTLPTAVATKYPADRMALLSHTQDATISRYFQLTAQQFEDDLTMLKTTRLDPLPNFHTFFVPGQTHTFLGNPAGAMTGGTNLDAWLGGMVSGDAGWMSVGP